MNIEKLHDQLINGLAHDLMFAKRYFHLFKEIEKHWSKMNLLNEVDKHWILLLKDSAVQQTVLYLSKIYDSSGERNERDTRCLRDLLKQLDASAINEAYKVIGLTPKLWAEFCNKHSIGFIKLGDVNATNFISSLKNYLDGQFSKNKDFKNKVLISLKAVRNKEVAHNENYVKEKNLSVDNVAQLIAISDAVLDFLNTYTSIEVSCLFGNQKYMITQQIEKIFKTVS